MSIPNFSQWCQSMSVSSEWCQSISTFSNPTIGSPLHRLCWQEALVRALSRATDRGTHQRRWILSQGKERTFIFMQPAPRYNDGLLPSSYTQLQCNFCAQQGCMLLILTWFHPSALECVWLVALNEGVIQTPLFSHQRCGPGQFFSPGCPIFRSLLPMSWDKQSLQCLAVLPMPLLGDFKRGLENPFKKL